MYIFRRLVLKWVILIPKWRRSFPDGSQGPSRNQNLGWLAIYVEPTVVVALTDVGAAANCQRDKLLGIAPRVDMADKGAIKVAEFGEREPVCDNSPGRPAVSGDETILGGEPTCESGL